MRRAAKVDDNQSDIVAVLRKLGASVQPLHAVGQGCPDLLLGYKGKNYLVEVKDGAKPPSARKLTKDQVIWHGKWHGQVVILTSIDDVLNFIRGIQ